MDSSNLASVIAAVGAIIAAAIAAWVVRKGAQESQRRTEQTTAVGMYPQLFQDQRTDIKDLRGRVTTLETTVTGLQGIIVAMRRRARAHMAWDDELIADYNNRIPGAHIRPAPPLLEDDEQPAR